MTIFTLLQHLIEIQIPLFQTLQSQICVSTLEIAAEKEISPELRACTNPILIIAPKFFTEEDVETLVPLTLHTSLDLCVELVQSGCDVSFLESIFDSIISLGYETEEVINTLIASCQTAIKDSDINQLYVLITALTGCIANGQEDLAAHAQEIFEIITTCIDDGDLFDLCCVFISEAATESPDIVSEFFEDYVDAISQLVPAGRSVETLDSCLLYTSPSPRD